MGFYAAFMVADEVEVYSHSATDDATYCWSSKGMGEYEITKSSTLHRGTTIVLHLKEDQKKFAIEQTINRIIKKYSNFVNHPIRLNGKEVNTVHAIWAMDKNKITEQQYLDFYHYIGQGWDTPLFRLHFSADAPIALNALFYVGSMQTEKMGLGRMEPGVSLYSRKVLIEGHSKNLLPEWMRFVYGVVDSEDIPLSLSRENMQDSLLVKRIRKILTKKFLRFLNDKSKKERATYLTFWNEFNPFLKEGVIQDYRQPPGPRLHSDVRVLRLRRFEADDTGRVYLAHARVAEGDLLSEHHEPRLGGELAVLRGVQAQEYRGAVPVQPDRRLRDDERARVQGQEVHERRERLHRPERERREEGGGRQARGEVGLDDKAAAELASWMKTSLGDKVKEVKITHRLVSSPAIVTDSNNAGYRRMVKMMQAARGDIKGIMPLEPLVLEVNPHHDLLVRLNQMKTEKPLLAQCVTEQLYDDCLVSAGLMDDSRTMIPRLNSLLLAALGGEFKIPAEVVSIKADDKKETVVKAEEKKN